jgi:hypothetical protein
MEDCEYILDYGNYATLMMGAGVGYFLIGYIITACLCQYRSQNIETEEILVARRV